LSNSPSHSAPSRDGDLRPRIFAQPQNLADSAASVRASLAAAEPFTAADLLLFAGMGASLFAVLPAADVLRRAGVPAFALAADELAGPVRAARLVALSNTGRSPETLDALTGHDGETLAITNDAESALATAADAHVMIGSGPDPVISVQTYTASLVAAALVAAELGGLGEPDESDRLPDLAAAVLDGSAATCARAAERFAALQAADGATPSCVDFVGGGPSLATAGAGALLFREACRRPAAWFSLRSYLHGPLEAAAEGTAHVVAGSGRAVELARDLVASGAQVLLVTTTDVPDGAGLEVVRIPAVHPALLPVLEILPVQLLVAELAERWAVSVQRFRYPQNDVRLP
jgi:glutamine---fructose-6-phosphate transaminase (isomerizing)